MVKVNSTFSQQLSNGLIIRQRLSEIVRFPFWEAEDERYKYFSTCGSIFLVNFYNEVYALTCKHVLKHDFNKLCITNRKLGVAALALKSLYTFSYLNQPSDGGLDNEIEYLAIIKFRNDVDISSFGDIYFWHKDTGE